MAKYRRRTLNVDEVEAFQVVEAYRFANDATSYGMLEWVNQALHEAGSSELARWVNNELHLPLQRGWYVCESGDWLVLAGNGKIYPYPDQLFGAIYEPAPDVRPVVDAKAELEAARATLIKSIYGGVDLIIEAAQTLKAGTDWTKSVELDTLAFDAAKLKAWALYVFRERKRNGNPL